MIGRNITVLSIISESQIGSYQFNYSKEISTHCLFEYCSLIINNSGIYLMTSQNITIDSHSLGFRSSIGIIIVTICDQSIRIIVIVIDQSTSLIVFVYIYLTPVQPLCTLQTSFNYVVHHLKMQILAIFNFMSPEK